MIQFETAKKFISYFRQDLRLTEILMKLGMRRESLEIELKSRFTSDLLLSVLPLLLANYSKIEIANKLKISAWELSTQIQESFSTMDRRFCVNLSSDDIDFEELFPILITPLINFYAPTRHELPNALFYLPAKTIRTALACGYTYLWELYTDPLMFHKENPMYSGYHNKSICIMEEALFHQHLPTKPIVFTKQHRHLLQTTKSCEIDQEKKILLEKTTTLCSQKKCFQSP